MPYRPMDCLWLQHVPKACLLCVIVCCLSYKICLGWIGAEHAWLYVRGSMQDHHDSVQNPKQNTSVNFTCCVSLLAC